jgi:hypothetical protein
LIKINRDKNFMPPRWRTALGDTILDRIVHNPYRLELDSVHAKAGPVGQEQLRRHAAAPAGPSTASYSIDIALWRKIAKGWREHTRELARGVAIWAAVVIKN